MLLAINPMSMVTNVGVTTVIIIIVALLFFLLGIWMTRLIEILFLANIDVTADKTPNLSLTSSLK